ncbi:MAG: hypothetical protein V1859_11310 [archaeon]
MDKLKIKKIISAFVDIIVYSNLFLVSYMAFSDILPFHLEKGLSGDILKYNFITPFFAGLLVVLLFRLLCLFYLKSTLGMKMLRLQFDKKDFSVIKYDSGLYMFAFSLILFNLERNFASPCCGRLDPISVFTMMIIYPLIIAGIIAGSILFINRNKSIKIINCN